MESFNFWLKLGKLKANNLRGGGKLSVIDGGKTNNALYKQPQKLNTPNIKWFEMFVLCISYVLKFPFLIKVCHSCHNLAFHVTLLIIEISRLWVFFCHVHIQLFVIWYVLANCNLKFSKILHLPLKNRHMFPSFGN